VGRGAATQLNRDIDDSERFVFNVLADYDAADLA
jgi:hypothetical protein